jgi:hypothetical protein
MNDKPFDFAFTGLGWYTYDIKKIGTYADLVPEELRESKSFVQVLLEEDMDAFIDEASDDNLKRRPFRLAHEWRWKWIYSTKFIRRRDNIIGWRYADE